MSSFPVSDEAKRRVMIRAVAAVVLLLALAIGVHSWTEKAAASRTGNVAVSVVPTGIAESHPGRSKVERPAGEVVEASVAPVLAEVPLPDAEGHGDDCMHCIGQEKLAAVREEYARMEHRRLISGRLADEEQSRRLLEACRQFAATVLTEWSFPESRPVLLADEIIDARRRDLLEPLLAQIPSETDRGP